jgi:O-antigen/teichoic acid export membrane protein
MSRTDQAVISFTIGVSFVTLYQAGYKVSDMFGLFSVQMQDALSPAAAQLSILKNQTGLRELLLQGMRLTTLLTTPLYGLCVVCLDPLIRVLTGLKHVDPNTWWVGQTLLLATYSSLVTSSCSKRILMMSGWERHVLYASLLDAVLNFIFSLVLVFKFGVLGVAIGTMVPTVLIGWLWILPLTARFCEIGLGELVRQVLNSILMPMASGLTALALMAWFIPVTTETGFIGCIWRGTLVVVAVLALGYPFLRQLRNAKRGVATATG